MSTNTIKSAKLIECVQFRFVTLTETPLTSIKGNKRMTPYQKQTLMKWYEAEPYLKREDRRNLAQSLKISEDMIRYWFIDRRKMQRRMGIFRGGE